MNLAKILKDVEMPARYTGGEYNTPVIKADAKLKYLMCFPDVYEVAMSNLGIRILYYLLNNRSDTACERCFAPWPDMAAALRQNNAELFSIETKTPVREFDIIGFSLQYELSYSNILYMLDLGNIPFRSRERTEDHPVIMAGGPCACNPEPLRDIVDIFVIGDGEEILNSLSDLFISVKANGGKKSDYLKAAADIEGVFVPAFPAERVRRAVAADLNNLFFPELCQVPNIEAVHDRPNLELFRGCIRGCRFCQAGFIYRPMRERSTEKLLETGKKLFLETGFDEMSLASLSTSDYSGLRELLQGFKEFNRKFRTKLSLPSLRLDSFEGEYTEDSRTSSLTFAPEAGTQRLRDVINKNITEADIDNAMQKAFAQGYTSIKLYFMLGLPTETDADVEGIAATARHIKQLYRDKYGKGRINISVSTSTFIPKPFTPFQWDSQLEAEEIRRRQDFLKAALGKYGIKYSYHDNKTSRIEAVFARGDSRLNEVLISAYNAGARFDGWSEHFRIERYEQAFSQNNIDTQDYLGGIDTNKRLPWDYIDIGVSRDFLLSEREKSRRAEVTPDCRTKCSNCGLKSACAVNGKKSGTGVKI